MATADEIIKKLNLEPLPGEGGYYRETYRSGDAGFPAREFGIPSDGTRNLSTAIYYLVTPDNFSALHRVRSDEIFHFYAGDPVEMIQIDSNGQLTQFVLGSDILSGQTPQILVPKGYWQSLRLVRGGKWGLFGTTVSPGFEFEDFELGSCEQLLGMYPDLQEHIKNFTRE